MTTAQLTQKGIRDLNEDKVLVNKAKSIFGVFDGASSLVPYLSLESKTGAYIAADIARDTFLRSDAKSLRETAIEANSNIEKAHAEAGIDLSKNVNRFGTTAAVARITKHNAEILQIGDSVVLVVYEDGHAEVPLGYHDHDLEVMRKWRQLADKGITNIRGIVNEDVIKLRESANSEYGLLNGDNKVENFLQTAVINLENVLAILLLTDGMFIPKSDPDSKEDWDYYASLYMQGGIKKIYETVRQIEDSDPDIIKYPRYKLHDDASAIAIMDLL